MLLGRCVLCRVSGLVVVLRYFGLRCRVLCCGFGCGAASRRCALLRPALCFFVPCSVVLLVSVPLLAVLCAWALSVALWSCAFRRCVLWFSPALCALCCVCLAVVLVHANCTPFVNRSTKISSSKKKVFFAILKVLFSAASQEMHSLRGLPIFWLFSRGQKNFFFCPNQPAYQSFSRKKTLFPNLKYTNFWNF